MASSQESQVVSSIVWGSSSNQLGLGSSVQNFGAEKSWLATYEHQAPNLTRFSFKAGNRDLALGGYDPKGKPKTNETNVKRKYS